MFIAYKTTGGVQLADVASIPVDDAETAFDSINTSGQAFGRFSSLEQFKRKYPDRPFNIVNWNGSLETWEPCGMEV